MKKLISISILAMIAMILIISGCTDPYNPPDPDPEEITISYESLVITEGEAIELTLSKEPDLNSFSVSANDPEVDAYIFNLGSGKRQVLLFNKNKTIESLDGTYNLSFSGTLNGKGFGFVKSFQINPRGEMNYTIRSEVITPQEEPSGDGINNIIVSYEKNPNNEKVIWAFIPTTEIDNENITKARLSLEDLTILGEYQFDQNGKVEIRADGVSIVEGCYAAIIYDESENIMDRIQLITGTEDDLNYKLNVTSITDQIITVADKIYFMGGKEAVGGNFLIPYGTIGAPNQMDEFMNREFQKITQVILVGDGYDPEFITKFSSDLKNLLSDEIEIRREDEYEITNKHECVVQLTSLPSNWYGSYGILVYSKELDLTPALFSGVVDLNRERYSEGDPTHPSLEAKTHSALREVLNSIFRPTSENDYIDGKKAYSFFWINN